MTNLTEQWKQGELPEGWYYLKGNRAEGIYAYTAEYLNNMYRPQNSGRIIEQVPSYDEWQAKLEENAQLKELLKDCKEHLITYKRDDLDKGYVVYDGSYLIDKINQVLGE